MYRPYTDLVSKEPLRRGYRKRQQLGSGSFGVVWRVVDRSSGATYAAKLIKPLTEKTAREIELHNFLPAHENIIGLRESLRHGESVFMILEFAGTDLFNLINEQVDGLREDSAREIFWGLARAVDHCHSHNIAHLDIKPENILLVPSGNAEESPPTPKLCDFGEAVFFLDGELETESAGAPDYVSPEILSASYFPPEADMWSLGVTLFAMLCGELPFTGPTEAVTFQRIRRASLDVNPLRGHCDNAALDLVGRLLEANPKKRLTSAQLLEHPWLAPCVSAAAG